MKKWLLTTSAIVVGILIAGAMVVFGLVLLL